MLTKLLERSFPTMATQREVWLNTSRFVFKVIAIFTLASSVVCLAWDVRLFFRVVVVSMYFWFAVGAFKFLLTSAHDAALDRLREAQFLICTACRFDLRSSVSIGKCPECGRSFNPDTLSLEWIRHYDHLKEKARPKELGE